MSPPLSSLCGRRSASRRRADRRACRRQRSSSFPRPMRSHAHRCSRLTRQHGGEQSGLLTLTFDLLTLKVVSESRVTWATSMPILIFLCLSVLNLGPMYTTDRQTSDRRQTASSLNAPPIRVGVITSTEVDVSVKIILWATATSV